MNSSALLPPGTTLASAAAHGKSLRAALPLAGLAQLTLPAARDPLAIIDAANAVRIPELIGVRTSRMLQSAFAFYRATADVMTADLANEPRTDLRLVICGDAHIANFGLYASPERRLLFDLNDFDESGLGPWEWDLKRLAASVVLALGDRDVGPKHQRATCVDAVRGYQQALATDMQEGALARFYATVDADWLQQQTQSAELDKSLTKARRNTSERVLAKITTTGDGGVLHIVDAPPLLVRERGLSPEQTHAMMADYLSTLRTDRALLMSQFTLVDVARRVVGVGSVGTHCGIALLQGMGGEPLVMQFKQALPSVLARYGGLGDVEPDIALHAPSLPPSAAAARHQGRRVVTGQQVLQAGSDPLLGWSMGPSDGLQYYWRQFRDMKGGVNLAAIEPGGLERYCVLCARQLARGHAQSPQAAAVAGYIGSSDDFAPAIADWAVAYAAQVQKDFAAFQAAVKAGRYPVTTEE